MDKKRLEILQSRLKHPVLIKKKENLLYLTGRSFMNGYLLIKKNDVVFFGDGLEKVEGIKKTARLKYIGKYLRRGGTLQIEDQFTFAESKYLKDKLPKVKISPVRSPVDYQRVVKDSLELANVRSSMHIVEKVFLEVKKQLARKRWTERNLANFIRARGLSLGAEDVSFEPIVAAGSNAAIPHHQPGHRKLGVSESIIIDFGFKYHSYCSDFTRTVFLKRAPSRLARAYEQAEQAYRAVIREAKYGIRAKHLYNLSLRILEEEKLGKYFIHNLGHGTGLEIHELPNLSPSSNDIMKDGMVFSVEPGVYIPKCGGIRIEDLVYLKSGKLQKFIAVPTGLEENILP